MITAGLVPDGIVGMREEHKVNLRAKDRTIIAVTEDGFFKAAENHVSIDMTFEEAEDLVLSLQECLKHKP